MANETTNLDLHGTKSVRKTRFSKWMAVAPLLILALTILYGVRASGGADISTQANQTNYTSFQTALRDQMHAGSELSAESNEAPKESSWRSFLTAFEIAVCIVLAVRLLAPKIGRLQDKRMNPATTAADKPKAEAGQKKAVANIAAELPVNPKSSAKPADQQKTTLTEFFKAAPVQLVAMLKLFAQISRSTDPAARQKYLETLGTELVSLKNRVGSLDLTPAWRLASTLEKFIEELREKPSHVTVAGLRTAGSGLLLLKDLCMPNVRNDLVTEPPARFLIVDDDPISRQAVSASLKKLSQTSDLAENGEAALKLAEQQAYDAIFLDVEMPGLDGFEVCTKIHQLDVNQKTAVIFVTGQENYESRTKSNPSGKTDLIVKPFLSSEIMLKATTVLLRGRLNRDKPRRELTSKETRTSEDKAGTNLVKSEDRDTAAKKPARATDEKSCPSPNQTLPGQEPKTEPIAAQPDTIPKEQKPGLAPSKNKGIPSADFEKFAEDLRELQIQGSALSVTENAELRQELLNEVYVGNNMVRSDAARMGLRSICEVSSALGKLVSKLLDGENVEDARKVETISSAIQLLEDLSRSGLEPDLAGSPIRALVVDDEPLARRAVSNALQLTIGKPDEAENGKIALALTESKPFDVIFLDIMMPEIDGFETCSKIRHTKHNAETPIIFVTSSKDTESREKSLNCGGNGFITKPVMPAEIFLTALTSTMRARMGKNEAKTASAEVLEEAVC